MPESKPQIEVRSNTDKRDIESAGFVFMKIFLYYSSVL